MFESVADAVKETGATATMVIVPARFAADAVIEAAEAGLELVVVVTEGIPMHDEARFYNSVAESYPATRILGPNCPGVLTVGECNIGFIPAEVAQAGWARRHRQSFRHAHLPGTQRAEREGHRRHHVRRHRR